MLIIITIIIVINTTTTTTDILLLSLSLPFQALSRLSSFIISSDMCVKFSLDQVFGELGDAFDAAGLYCDPVERTSVFDTVKKVVEKDKDVRRLM